MFAIFALFAYVQLNDPDPVIWFLCYGMVSLLFLISMFTTVPGIVLYALMTALFVFSLFHLVYFFEWVMSDDKSELVGEMLYDKPYIEGTREFLGLIIAIGALFYLRSASSKKVRN
jgi:hypothetical protein